MKKIYLFVICAALTASCGKSARINGRFSGANNETVYLEMVTPSFAGVIDSAVTNKTGAYRFKVNIPDGGPILYSLMYKSRTIPLLISRGERVSVSSIWGIGPNHTVSGSQGSEEVRQVSAILSEGAILLDSIRRLYLMESDTELRREIANGFTREYYRVKREHLNFIMEHLGSVSGIYALFQRLPDDDVLFNGESDIVYFRMAADSVEKYNPNSPYLTALRNGLSRVDGMGAMADMLSNIAQEPQQDFPDIAAEDVYGKMRQLSELKGKVILLLFWSSTLPDAPLLLAEMKEIYESINSDRFEIFQVSLDTDKSAWVTNVLRAHIPWISVNEFRGTSSPSLGLYNISAIPALYLIDSEGNITGKDIPLDQLESAVRKLL